MPDNVMKIDLHKEFNLKPDSKVILSAGRLAEQKRFDLIIEVAAMAKSQNHNWSFIIAGIGRLEKELNKMAIDRGVDDIIKFIGFRDDVLTLMKSANLFVLPSDSEGMSNALREAMGVGLPCIATDVFGVEELFQDGKSGLMVEKGDSKAIFNAIINIFSNEELRISLLENGTKLIKESFTMERMIDEVEKLFEDQLKMSSKN